MNALAVDQAMGMLDDIEARSRREVDPWQPAPVEDEPSTLRGMMFAVPLALMLWAVLFLLML
jgi:hypothetical protein